MNILDENVPEDQRSLLQTWGFQFTKSVSMRGRRG